MILLAVSRFENASAEPGDREAILAVMDKAFAA
jgi:hypothetical protein